MTTPAIASFPKRFLVYARAPFLTAAVVPALLGAALAWHEVRAFDGLRFALALFGLALAHAGVNLSNDYFDFRQGADQNNRNRNRFSGGSPFMVEGTESPRRFLHYMLAAFALALACGIALAGLVDRGVGPVAWLMLAGFFGGFFYTAPPLRFAYRGVGEIFIFLCFGPLSVLGAYYVQTASLSWRAALLGVPIGLLITNVLWINQFPDAESDGAAGKRTLVVRLGLARARWGYHGMALAAGLTVTVLAVGSYWMLLGLLAAPLIFRAGLTLHRHYEEPQALLPAMGQTVAAHLALGVLLTVALLLS
jgi:1,4-dihydroxy-2-naphthoate polyprenyltransferase